ncbi:DegV family protein [Collinsella sp. zg1085]|uniref:DegV family protein n=1 Tax=Collinsella sp. zg1085 TaxID=2844380 RepID=UPI001C0E8748|nr:DegV family protein [Collinsella sp. zg1085]QWT17008.1 DegV family protein [Collinsella sp. zg1085]
MSWCIAADSSCNFLSFTPTSPDCIYGVAPLSILVDGVEYVDSDDLSVQELIAAFTSPHAMSTSSACPSPGDWAKLMRSADNVICVTIGSKTSGSYDCALTAKQIVMDEYESLHPDQEGGKRIHVIDSKGAGAQLEVLIHRLDSYIAQGLSFDEIVSNMEAFIETTHVYYSLSSFDNLVKAGRLPRLVGTLASKLNIRLLGSTAADGALRAVGPTRGEKKTFKKIIDCLVHDNFGGGVVYIDHVNNEPTALLLKQEIVNIWPEAEIHICACRGLCSYYAEVSGIIIAFESETQR